MIKEANYQGDQYPLYFRKDQYRRLNVCKKWESTFKSFKQIKCMEGIMPEAYCVKDKKTIEIQNPRYVILKNNTFALTGNCPICGREVYRFAKRQQMDPKFALEMAINRETGAMEFYREAAERTQDNDGKKMLKWLSDREYWHRDGLEKQLKSILDKQEWQQWKEESTPLTVGEIEQASETAHTREATSLKHVTQGEVSALRTAMRAEKKAIDFYKECAEATTDPAGKSMFQSLARHEEGHLKLIERAIETVKQHRRYLLIPRFLT